MCHKNYRTLFECESYGITFVTFNPHFVGQINGQTLIPIRVCATYIGTEGVPFIFILCNANNGCFTPLALVLCMAKPESKYFPLARSYIYRT